MWVQRTLNDVDTFVSDWVISALYLLHVFVTCIILCINISELLQVYGNVC